MLHYNPGTVYLCGIITKQVPCTFAYNTGISTSEMKVIMKYAGCLQPISQGVFLLSEAVIAYQ